MLQRGLRPTIALIVGLLAVAALLYGQTVAPDPVYLWLWNSGGGNMTQWRGANGVPVLTTGGTLTASTTAAKGSTFYDNTFTETVIGNALLGFNAINAGWSSLRGGERVGLGISRQMAPMAQARIAWVVQGSLTNTAGASQLLNLTAGGTRTITFNNLTLSSTVATQVNVVLVSAAGATCTALTPRLLRINDPLAPTATTTNQACTTPPTTVAIVYSFFMAANSSVTLDLSMLMTKQTPTAGEGISIQTPAAFTGTVASSVEFAESLTGT